MGSWLKHIIAMDGAGVYESRAEVAHNGVAVPAAAELDGRHQHEQHTRVVACCPRQTEKARRRSEENKSARVGKK